MRGREGGARQSPRPRAGGFQPAPCSLVPVNLGLQGACLGGSSGRGESGAGSGLWAGRWNSPPTELPHPPVLPLSPSHPLPHPLLLFPPPSLGFHLSCIFSSQMAPLSTSPFISLFFLFPLPSALHLSLSTHSVLPSPSSPHPKGPGSRRGPDPTKEPSEAESPLSAER